MQLTRHAEARANQRGIRWATLEALVELADFAKPIARGKTVLRISRRSLSLFMGEGFNSAALDRLKNLAVVESETGVLITCAHIRGRKAKSYLRRDRRKFWRA